MVHALHAEELLPGEFKPEDGLVFRQWRIQEVAVELQAIRRGYTSRGESSVHWYGFPALLNGVEDFWSQVDVRLQENGAGNLSILAGAPGRAEQPAPKDFFDKWEAALESIGTQLYPRTRPAFGAVTLSDPIREATWSGQLSEAVSRRELIVGWRTWFGPPYVNTFGTEWLRQLPDESIELEDGGVFHRFNSSLVSFLATRNDPSRLSLESFLHKEKLQPVWCPLHLTGTSNT